MNEPLGLLGTPHINFLTLVVIGGLVGWISGIFLSVRHWAVTNMLIGVIGSWAGSELAVFLGFVIYGSFNHLFAALAGAIVVLYIWQMLYQRL
ncbi:GlsB/YeaQ/YmgE family stress response membrane protein [Methylovirgula sp. 4M-Z18]|uniref:GlsB/YeaQ/YmgE family stress response membrane protein n=1 Tax=Methylovirgula sp. 4M-Z18 TaxID=2293567 RepID=UPI000E2F336C|nr:GlsB/YeaQ/YmgE family stress response membrane protein [Methylovirgula sp. 4M-Z18]RFB80232.1 GlsB/YeaQ/YmgE family stress response membrane protein [Methylovirgula sp. 4M-Z18]